MQPLLWERDRSEVDTDIQIIGTQFRALVFPAGYSPWGVRGSFCPGDDYYGIICRNSDGLCKIIRLIMDDTAKNQAEVDVAVES